MKLKTAAVFTIWAFVIGSSSPLLAENRLYQQRGGNSISLPNVHGGMHYIKPGQRPVITLPNVHGGYDTHDYNRQYPKQYYPLRERSLWQDY